MFPHVSIEPNGDGGCRFHRDLIRGSEEPYSPYSDALIRRKLFSAWSNPIKADVIDALLKFPKESFFNELFFHHKVQCPEYNFTYYVLKIISLLVGLVFP